jgi:hypothetical protein
VAANAARDSLQELQSQDSDGENAVPTGNHTRPHYSVAIQDQVKQISQRP